MPSASGGDVGHPGDPRGAGATAGLPAVGRVEPERGDRRWSDEAWTRYPPWFGLQQTYLLWSRSMYELVEGARLDGPARLKAETQFSLERMVRDYEALYLQMAQGRVRA